MPRILVLDEPTIGLDPQAKHLVWHKLDELKAQGVTHLLCTQNMEEATVLCDRVAIMNQGKILSLDTPQALVSRHVGSEIGEIEVDSSVRDKVVRELASHGFDFEDTGRIIYVFHADSSEFSEGWDSLNQRLRWRLGTLEDVFLRLTGRSLAE